MGTHVGGHPMGTKSSKAKPAPLGPVSANTEIELEVGLKAPKPSRDFGSKWRMSMPDGHQFGDFLWTIITVDPNAPSGDVSSSAAAADPPAASASSSAAAASAVATKPADKPADASSAAA